MTGASEGTGSSHAWRLAACLVVPYLFLGLAWTLSNPPGAAPDEKDHLVKALGSAGFSAGSPAPQSTQANLPLGTVRNNSITRYYAVPKRVAPGGEFACFAFRPDATANCLPTRSSAASGTVSVPSAVGAYPPFLYVPLGIAARTASTPAGAFYNARLAVLVMSSLLLMLGVQHLARWVGAASLVGPVVTLTPMATFLFGVVSLSAVEVCAAITVGAVVAVGVRRPNSLYSPGTHWTLLIAGAALALSRQLGLVALAALSLTLIWILGGRGIRRLFHDRQPSALVCVAGVAGSAVLESWWEFRFDHPAVTGSAFNPRAIVPFLDLWPGLVQSAVGNFGWLDTPLPGPAVTIWIAMWGVVLGIGFLSGTASEATLVAGWLVLAFVIAFAIYSSVFYPIGASAQGRHFLPLASFSFVLAGVCLARSGSLISPSAAWRLFGGLGASVCSLQFVAVYWNARRYAVGQDGPLWFLADARWSPPLGWASWLLVAAAASVALGLVIVRIRPGADAPEEGAYDLVER